MADGWISKLVGRYSAPDPFEKDGIEASPFVRDLVMDVHRALAERDFLTALKRITVHSVFSWDDAKMRAQALQFHEKNTRMPLNKVDILEHRWDSQRLEFLRAYFHSDSNAQDMHFLGVHVFHGDDWGRVLNYRFGLNLQDAGLG